ncbi:acetate kinase [Gaertneriomyces semiglobifer]|nr:acetate kinase [Gaertneriomyces semiglobifer]
MPRILIINSGSSTVKFRVYTIESPLKVVCKGSVSKLGSDRAPISITIIGGEGDETKLEDHVEGETDHDTVFRKALEILKAHGVLEKVEGVGHRVVHGGSKFRDPVIITPSRLSDLDELSAIAPLHNHPSVIIVRAALESLSHATHVAVFDTAFHRTLPEHVYTYPLPYDACLKNGLRKYGFHGMSHHYVGKRCAKLLNRPFEELKLITLHLGNGASACAIRNGKSIDTSMGFTPLEGLMMGTRAGDIDPALPYHLQSDTFSVEGSTPAIKSSPKGPKISKAEDVLNHQSGLRGVCGESDIRKVIEMMESDDGSVEQEKRRRARLAFDMFCYRLEKYIGQYYVALSGCDAIVFTGGIGENSAKVRQTVCRALGCLGIVLDEKQNQACAGETEITTSDTRVKVFVIPTDEEGEMAKAVAGFLTQ